MQWNKPVYLFLAATYTVEPLGEDDYKITCTLDIDGDGKKSVWTATRNTEVKHESANDVF